MTRQSIVKFEIHINVYRISNSLNPEEDFCYLRIGFSNNFIQPKGLIRINAEYSLAFSR